MIGVFLLMQPLRGICFINFDPRVALSVSRIRDTVSATRGYFIKPLRGNVSVKKIVMFSTGSTNTYVRTISVV